MMTRYIVRMILAVSIIAFGPGCEDSRTADDSSRATEDAKSTPTARLSREGFSIVVPAGYKIAEGPDFVLERERVEGQYTANIAVLEPPKSINVATLATDLAGASNEDRERVCSSFAHGVAEGTATNLVAARVAKAKWGTTCEAEMDRPDIGARALITLMKKKHGYVIVVGHFGLGDKSARGEYAAVIESWSVGAR